MKVFIVPLYTKSCLIPKPGISKITPSFLSKAKRKTVNSLVLVTRSTAIGSLENIIYVFCIEN